MYIQYSNLIFYELYKDPFLRALINLVLCEKFLVK